MENFEQKLNDYVQAFLSGQIDDRTFEEEFSNVYDFEDTEDSKYFEEIRALLERFSAYETDLKNYSDYYISEQQLRKRIKGLISN